MAKIHDKFVIELAEVIKGYGNNPDVEDPFMLSMFYRFYELPNIAVSRENFEKMRPVEPERKTWRWIVKPAPDRYHAGEVMCPFCRTELIAEPDEYSYCPTCGARLGGEVK